MPFRNINLSDILKPSGGGVIAFLTGVGQADLYMQLFLFMLGVISGMSGAVLGVLKLSDELKARKRRKLEEQNAKNP